MSLLLQQGRRGFLLLVGESAFYIQPSPDWMRPTTLGRAVIFILSTDLNVNLTQKQLHSHIQDNVAQSRWHMKVITTHCLHRDTSPGSRGLV